MANQPERIDLAEIPINDRMLPIVDKPMQFPRPVLIRTFDVEEIPPACPHCRLVGGGHTATCVTQLPQWFSEATLGGLAEAGWQHIGYAVDGPDLR